MVELAAAPPGDEVTVVFDGRPDQGEVAAAARLGVELVFAPGGPDAADRVIAARARQVDEPGAHTVVTSDRELARAVRAAGVAVIGVSAFRRRWDEPPVVDDPPGPA